MKLFAIFLPKETKKESVCGWNDRRNNKKCLYPDDPEYVSYWNRCDKRITDLAALRDRCSWSCNPPTDDPFAFIPYPAVQYYTAKTPEDVILIERSHDAKSCHVLYNNKTNQYDIIVRYCKGQ